MRELRVSGITASLGGREILHGIDLDVPAGTTSVILGPSGCGKTTLLRVIAGFQVPDRGTVSIGGAAVVSQGATGGRPVWVPPERRGVGYVSQEGNLFPHLSVGANILYGVPRGRRRDPEASGRLGELLDLVGLDADLAQRRPDQLSGGQQQRVALARALARRPSVVLLDEPFSSLDAGLRAGTREAVAEALAREQVTVVLVTHDQDEALSFADQVAIMSDGLFTQVGTPRQVYEAPTDVRSATFLGDAVVLPGRSADGVVHCALGVLPLPGGDRDAAAATAHGLVDVLVRPEQIRLVEPDTGGASGPGATNAVVERTTYFGHDALVVLRLPDATTVKARVVGLQLPAIGATVGLETVGPPQVFPAGAARRTPSGAVSSASVAQAGP